jgi:hypothetical protein
VGVPDDVTAAIASTLKAVLDVTGYFEIVLPASDDPDTSPTGWTYNVVEFLVGSGVANPAPYDLFVPIEYLSMGFDLSRTVAHNNGYLVPTEVNVVDGGPPDEVANATMDGGGP